MSLGETISIFLLWDYFKRNDREDVFWYGLLELALVVFGGCAILLGCGAYHHYQMGVAREAFEQFIVTEQTRLDQDGVEIAVPVELVEALQKDQRAWDFYHEMRVRHNVTMVDHKGNTNFPHGDPTGWRMKRGGGDGFYTVFGGMNGGNGAPGWNTFIGLDKSDNREAVADDPRQRSVASVDGVELLNALRSELNALKKRLDEAGM